MTPERWGRIQEVFAAVLDHDPPTRDELLDELCAADVELRHEVGALLVAHDNSGVMDRLATDVVQPLTPGVIAAPNGFAGRAVSHYEIGERLNGGGMGVVYRAQDTRLNRPVALKFILPELTLDSDAERRFVLEAQAAAVLEHPNVCTIYEIGQTSDGQLFIAMPLYDGESLRDKLQRGPLDYAEAVAYMAQVCAGLAKTHSKGIIHRDVKPANVLVTNDGIVKLLDFGIAKLSHGSLSGTGRVVGTAAYMSPEQAGGERVDPRADIWSVGVLLYELLSGEVPFKGQSHEAVVHSVLTDEPTSIVTFCPGLPGAVADIVHWMLQKDPDQRPATMGELAAAFDAMANDGTRQLGAGVKRRLSGQAPRLLPEGERRQVTVLAIYITGYDQMVERLRSDEVDHMLERVYRVVEGIVVDHGGVVNHWSGDEIIALFGVPRTHEDDPLRAGRAALSVHDLIGELQDLPVPVSLQSGVDYGRVIVQTNPTGDQRYRVVGDAMQIAARLGMEAESGEVLVSSEWHRLVAPFFESEARGEIQLKGGASAGCHLLRSVSAHGGRLEAATEIAMTAYSGRQDEMALLASRFADAVRGDGQFVSITGDAGLGKSRLLHEFGVTLNHGDGVTILRGRCQSYGNATVYLPFLNMLRATLGFAQDQPDPHEIRAASARLDSLGDGLQEFFPIYLHVLSIASDEFPLPNLLRGEALRVGIREALSALFTMRAAADPIVLFLEDWHWADDASADVLNQLVALAPSYLMLILVTCRPEYGVQFGAQEHHTAIRLPPLDATCSVAVVRSVLGVDEVLEELGRFIYARTGGNPFFLEEITHALLEAGAVDVRDGRALLVGNVETLEVPDTVQGVIRGRLDRMRGHDREVLCFASVVGREFTADILQDIRSVDTQLHDALERLKNLGVIQQTRILPSTEYRFKHALTQEVTYESLLLHQRRDLHGRVGRAIEQLHSDRLDEHFNALAWHFAHAEDWERAVHYGMLTSVRAQRISEFQESRRILEATEEWLAQCPAGPETTQIRIDLLLRKERLFEILGLRRQQLEIILPLIELLEPQGNGAELAEAHLRLGDVYVLLREFAPAEKALVRSVDICDAKGDQVGRRKALRSLGMLHWHRDGGEEAVSIIERLLEEDRLSGDLDAVLADTTNLATVLRDLGRYDECRKTVVDGIALAEQVDNVAKKSYLLHVLGSVERLLGNMDEASKHLDVVIELNESNRLYVELGFNLITRAHLYFQQGETKAALNTWTRAVQLLRSTQNAQPLLQALRTLGDVLIGLQRHAEALPYLDEATGLCRQLEDHTAEAATWSRIGVVHEHLGAYSDAMAAWSRARVLCQEHRLAEEELNVVLGMARFTRDQVPEPSLALQYYREGLQLTEALGDAVREAKLRNTIAIIEWERQNYDTALAHYERALVLAEASGDQADVGLIATSIGVTLHKLHRTDEAVARLQSAIQHNHETGARQLEGFGLAALGDVYHDTGRMEESLTSYTQSLDIRREIKDRRGEAWMLHHLASAHATVGALDRKRDCASEAWRIGEAIGDEELLEAMRRLKT